MKQITMQNAPIGDTVKIQGKLHILYSVEEVVRVGLDNTETIEYKGYISPAVTDNAEYIANTKAKLEAEVSKLEAASTLGTLTVTTTNGNTFDANTQARLDILDGIAAATTLGRTETTWRLSDNSEVLIGIDELKEAQALAIAAYAAVKSIGVNK